MQRFLLLLPLMLTAGCVSGPDFARPADPAATAGYATSGGSRAALAEGPDAQWWGAFGSAELDELVDTALARNHSLAASRATLESARQRIAAIAGKRLPQVDARGRADYQQVNLSAIGLGERFAAANIGNPEFDLYTVGAGITYDTDLFGRNRRALEQATAEAEAIQRETEAAHLIIAGRVVAQVFSIAALNDRIATERSLIAEDERNLALTEARRKAGAGTLVEVLSAQGQLSSDRANLPALEQDLAEGRAMLAILLGLSPAELDPADFSLAQFALPDQVPVAIPSRLVRKRPDILQAEARLHAATAAIGVAEADLYPDISLGASITQSTSKPGKIASSRFNAFDIFAGLTAPIFHGGTLKANKRGAQARAVAAAETYQQTVIEAFGQVSGLLSALGTDGSTISVLTETADIAGRSLHLSRRSFEVGNSGILQVLDSSRSYQRARIALLEARANQYRNVARLYVATAGGWIDRPEPGGSEPNPEAHTKRMTQAYPDPATRGMITTGCMMATIMVALDGTIANVALPHMQSAMMASIDQIVWVLTSYMIAAAIATPLSGWLAQRYGRKKVMMVSVAGFTLASLACGLSANLEELVLFRILQGMCGAAMVPLSQATLLDINPPERHGQAMAIYGMGSVLGPVVGPTLGGYLTDAFSWHWIFLINLPVGIVSLLLISGFMSESRSQTSRFDLTGFALLSIAVASTQLMLDRGQHLDWFDSWEIRLEATVAGLFAFLTVVHMLFSPDAFIKPALLRNRNFALGSVISLIHGMLIFSVMALMAPMLQHLMGYSAMQTGLVSMPRSIGTMLAMWTVGMMVAHFDARWLVAAGLIIAAAALYGMAQFSLMMGEWTIVWIGFFQGFGAGFIFVPLSTLLFSTLDPKLRNEGASLFALTRMIGAAIGISILQAMTTRNSAAVHSRLVEGIRPDNPILGIREPGADFGLPGWIAAMNGQITREAAMVGYVDAYFLLCGLVAVTIPLAFLMTREKAH